MERISRALTTTRRFIILLLVVVVLVVVAWFIWGDDSLGRKESWGEPTDRILSDDGELALVTYEFTALIDSGWNIAIEEEDGNRREWVWRSVESYAPESIKFADNRTIEITDQDGNSYTTEFDRDTLEPTDRFCLNFEHCRNSPWDGYTQSGTPDGVYSDHGSARPD